MYANIYGQYTVFIFLSNDKYVNDLINLRFFVGYGLELSRLVPLIIFHLKKKYLCKTEAEVKEAWAPGDLGFATRIPGDMLILTIVLCYCVIAPIIIPFGALYFGIGWLVLRNQASPVTLFDLLLERRMRDAFLLEPLTGSPPSAPKIKMLDKSCKNCSITRNSKHCERLHLTYIASIKVIS